MAIVSVENLVKIYPNGTKAVSDISFEVGEGEFFGFLGPNGAGKTTTIKVLTTLLKKTSGRVSISGFDVDQDASKIRSLIGVQSQEVSIDEDLTGRENLEILGHLYGMDGGKLKERISEILSLVGLEEQADKRVAYYSSGMKKRLDLGTALVHNPKLLFLDEPTTGLDPQSRAAVWKYLQQLNRERGVTVFLTTQYMEEADRLCDRIAIIDYGKIVAEGTPAQLKQSIRADVITVTLKEQDPNELARLLPTAKAVAERIGGVSKVTNFENGLAIYASDGASMIPSVIHSLDEAQVELASISLSSPSLDDVFLLHTGRKIRPEELKKIRTGPIGFRRR